MDLHEMKEVLNYTLPGGYGTYEPTDEGYQQYCDDTMELYDALETLDKLIERLDKYKWHDLRKNPNDLPVDGSIVWCQHYPGLKTNPAELCAEHEFIDGYFAYNWNMDEDFNSDTFGKRYYGPVYAWKYRYDGPFKED